LLFDLVQELVVIRDRQRIKLNRLQYGGYVGATESLRLDAVGLTADPRGRFKVDGISPNDHYPARSLHHRPR